MTTMYKRLLLLLSLIIFSLSAQGNLLHLFRSKPYPEAFFHGDLLAVAEAIKQQDVDTIQSLASQLEDIDAPGEHGMTLLAFAVADNNPPAIQTLMKLGTDPSIEIKKLGTVAYFALWRTTTEPLRALLEAGMDPNIQQTSEPLIYHVPDLAQSDALKVLIEFGADVNVQDALGETALFSAVRVSFDEAIYLLDHGADGHAISHDGGTVAYSVQSRLTDMEKQSDAYQKMLEIKQKLVGQGVPFPALSPWGERFVRDIVYCDEPKGYHPRSECKVVGINQYEGKHPKLLRIQDEQILKERFNIEHKF